MSGQATLFPADALARFWERVERRGPEECWPWLGKLGQRDYGRIMVGGVHYPAQVYSWMIHHRAPFPAGMKGCHRCDNPLCVNPLHVWAGTQRENMLDAREKGRLRASRQTHCSNGHELAGDNLHISPRTGWRKCRACARQRVARCRAALREAA